MNIKEAIISIITEKQISTQTELVEELKKQGISKRQATISRQFKDLGIYKAFENGKIFYKIPVTDTSSQRINRFVKSVEYNEYLIVVKTNDGAANLVGDIIDKMNIPEILGSIAGDNTLFITTKSVKDIKKVHEKIINTIGY